MNTPVSLPNPRTRVGKIARLPESIREQLNLRLADGQPASEILPWLNALLETQRVLRTAFHNQPINAWNLTVWRKGGYADWREQREKTGRLKEVATFIATLSGASADRLTEGAAALATAKILELLDSTHDLTLDTLRDVINSLVRLRASATAQQNATLREQSLQHQRELGEAPARMQDHPKPPADVTAPGTLSPQAIFEALGIPLPGKPDRT